LRAVKHALSRTPRNRGGSISVCSPTPTAKGGFSVSILWIILIIVLVLLLLGFFSRGRW
jgi:Zn-dependent protease with chaperone function